MALKISHNTETRRVAIQLTGLHTITQLQELTQQLFPVLAQQKLAFTYIDPEGDKITVANDADIREAVRTSIDSSSNLRIKVDAADTTEKEQIPTSPKVLTLAPFPDIAFQLRGEQADYDRVMAVPEEERAAEYAAIRQEIDDSHQEKEEPPQEQTELPPVDFPRPLLAAFPLLRELQKSLSGEPAKDNNMNEHAEEIQFFREILATDDGNALVNILGEAAADALTFLGVADSASAVAETDTKTDAVSTTSLVIKSAWYGHPSDETKRSDVIDRLHFVQQLGEVGGQTDMAAAGEGFLTLSGGPQSYNRLFEVDPCPGVRKRLRIEYAVPNKQHLQFVECHEDQELVISDSQDTANSTSDTTSASTCPQGHILQLFQAHHGGFSCDGCQHRVPLGSDLHGCRTCDFDLCPNCVASSEETCTDTPHPLIMQAFMLAVQKRLVVGGSEGELKATAKRIFESYPPQQLFHMAMAIMPAVVPHLPMGVGPMGPSMMGCMGSGMGFGPLDPLQTLHGFHAHPHDHYDHHEHGRWGSKGCQGGWGKRGWGKGKCGWGKGKGKGKGKGRHGHRGHHDRHNHHFDHHFDHHGEHFDHHFKHHDKHHGEHSEHFDHDAHVVHSEGVYLPWLRR
jgi:hypothetical protein